jgi:hypothetical protein
LRAKSGVYCILTFLVNPSYLPECTPGIAILHIHHIHFQLHCGLASADTYAYGIPQSASTSQEGSQRIPTPRDIGAFPPPSSEPAPRDIRRLAHPTHLVDIEKAQSTVFHLARQSQQADDAHPLFLSSSRLWVSVELPEEAHE